MKIEISKTTKNMLEATKMKEGNQTDNQMIKWLIHFYRLVIKGIDRKYDKIKKPEGRCMNIGLVCDNCGQIIQLHIDYMLSGRKLTQKELKELIVKGGKYGKEISK
jgi:hypothetical protein